MQVFRCCGGEGGRERLKVPLKVTDMLVWVFMGGTCPIDPLNILRVSPLHKAVCVEAAHGGEARLWRWCPAGGGGGEGGAVDKAWSCAVAQAAATAAAATTDSGRNSGVAPPFLLPQSCTSSSGRKRLVRVCSPIRTHPSKRHFYLENSHPGNVSFCLNEDR